MKNMANGTNRLLLVAIIILLPVLIQIFYTGFNFFDFSNFKWLTYKGNRVILFFLWMLVILGVTSFFRLRVTYLSIPIFFSILISIYSIVTQENVEYEVFAAITNTSYQETIEFISSYVILGLLVALICIFISLYLFLLKPVSPLGDFIGVRKNAIVLLMIGVVGIGLMYVYSRDTLYKTYPVSIPFYFKKYYKDVIIFKKEFNEIDYSFEGTQEYSNNNSLYILIIGESARKQSFSSYGYHRDTTPYMLKAINSGKVKASVYDAISSGISTRLSVPLLLSTANVINYASLGKSPTLPHFFNDAGFQTILLSNQQASGRNNDIIALISNKMKDLTYLSESDDTRGYDGDLLSHIKVESTASSQATFMIVHLMGSHWKYNQRYPSEFSIFSGAGSRVDTYDNSIRYTDYIIGQVVDFMKQSNRPIQLFYTSDHGENLNDSGDGNYLHAIKEMTEYEVKVPLFFATNLAFYNKYKSKVDRILGNKNMLIGHDNISHTILGLAGLYDENYYKNKYDLSSRDFSQSKRYSINRRSEVINVDEYLGK